MSLCCGVVWCAHRVVWCGVGVGVVCDNQDQEVRNDSQPDRNKADTIRHESDNDNDMK